MFRAGIDDERRPVVSAPGVVRGIDKQCDPGKIGTDAFQVAGNLFLQGFVADIDANLFTF